MERVRVLTLQLWLFMTCLVAPGVSGTTYATKQSSGASGVVGH